MNEEFMRRFTALVAESFPILPGETLDAYGTRAIAAGLSPSQRAMIAARMVAVSDELKAERQARKTAWIAAARVSFSPGRRTACCVCGKFQDIAEAHHVIPLAAQFDRGSAVPNHEHAWLCPNHHAIIHRLIGPEDLGSDDASLIARGRSTAGLVLERSREELEILLDLLAQSGRRE